MDEIGRLYSLIPARMQSRIAIERSDGRSGAKLIATQRIDRSQWVVTIDLRQWQALDPDLCNLLFWHEIARVDNGAIGNERATYVALWGGLAIGIVTLPTHNIGSLAAAWAIAGLAAFRLYQTHLGERQLQLLTTADRDAVELAIEFGYPRETAIELLKSALSQTQRQSTGGATRYAARLQVLDLTRTMSTE